MNMESFGKENIRSDGHEKAMECGEVVVFHISTVLL